MSIDEAYLDVTINKFVKSAVKVAKLIQYIWQELHLTYPAGVSYNKFIPNRGL